MIRYCWYRVERLTKTIGLSVAEFISVVMTPRTKSIVSWTIPCTWKPKYRTQSISCTCEAIWKWMHIYHLRSASQGVSILDPVAESVALRDLAWISLRVEEGAKAASNLGRPFSQIVEDILEVQIETDER